MQSINLRQVTFKQALAHAKMLSGKTNAEICEVSGLSPANVAKYFKEHEAYYPNPCNIPTLCAALGNTVLVDWQVAQVAEVCPESIIVGAKDLTDAALSITGYVGKFCESVRLHVEDGQVSRREAKDSQGQIAAMMDRLKSMHDALEPLASGQITDNGGN